MARLDGGTVVITGASSGIGLAAAEAVAVPTDITEPEAVDALARAALLVGLAAARRLDARG